MSPIGISACLPQRTQQWSQEWWKLSPTQLVDNSEDSNNEEADIAQCFGATTGYPRTFKEVMQCNDALEWRQAALDELAAHKSNRTWTLVPHPKDSPVIGSKWMFIKKYWADGSFECYKGHLVVQGFSQCLRFEYFKVFAPIVHLSILQVILALAAIHDLHLWSVDISNVYLNGKMDYNVYMEYPEEFVEGDQKELVCLLKKLFYCTKQGKNHWNCKMHTTLKSIGFTQTYSDTTVYVYVWGDVQLILPVFIDNMIFASKSLNTIK